MPDHQNQPPNTQEKPSCPNKQPSAPYIVDCTESYRTPPLRHILSPDGSLVPNGYCDVNLYHLSNSSYLLRITTTPGQHIIALPKPQISLRPNFYDIYTAPILDSNGLQVEAVFVTVGENMNLDIGWYTPATQVPSPQSEGSSTVFYGMGSPVSEPLLGRGSPVFEVEGERIERRVTM